MQPVSEASVLGAFDGSQLRRNGVISTFFRRDGGYWVETDGPDNKLREYRVAYVFGVYPLQQYLIALPGGRLQALDIAWDSRPAADGGQRWFRLGGLGGSSETDDAAEANVEGTYSTADGHTAPAAKPTSQHTARDPLHWTGPYYNWNSRCAECHSTNLSKAYDPASGTYATTWSEVNVACEACHGPGARHVALAEAGRLHTVANSGLATILSEAGGWTFAPGEKIAQRDSLPDKPRQVENCARCHARRTALREYRHGVDFLDTHLPALLEDGLYYADGQIRDEVYVYGSFAQSKMYQAGVTCADCHNPHSLVLRAPGNAVCAQCHLPSAYDTPTHHHHAVGSPGAACVNCHMPATVYMEVDPRRDHSFQIPRPDLSAVIGTPNACNRCHEDRSIAWATAALADWGVDFADTGSHPGHLLQGARHGDRRAVHGLQAIAMDDATPSIWRATAAAEGGRFPSQEVVNSAARMLTSDDAMLRLAAVRAIEFLPQPQRLRVLRSHFQDPAAAVRTEIARVLSDAPLGGLDERLAGALETLFDGYLRSLERNADMPEALARRGDFLVARQRHKAAEAAYRNALTSDPQYVPALLNLADLYRLLEREDQARQVLRTAVGLMPEQAAIHHALGLLETRAGDQEFALRHLARAAELETGGVRYRYVHAIALHDAGDPQAAINALKALLRVAPGNAEVLVALVHYSRASSQLQDARRYAAKLRELFPNDPAIRRLQESL